MKQREGVLVQGKKVAHGPEECSVALVRESECTAAATQHRQQMKLAQGITKIGVNAPDNILRRGVAGAMVRGPFAIGLATGRVSRVQWYS